MTHRLRTPLIFLLGATAALPFGLPVPGGQAASLPADLLVWPVVVAALFGTGPRDWRLLVQDPVGRLLAAFLVVTAVSLPIGLALFHTGDGVRSYAYQAVILANFAAGCVVIRNLDEVRVLVKGFAGSIGVFSILLDGFLLQSGILKNVHSFHNSHLISTVIYGWPNAFSVLIAVALLLCLYVIASAETLLVRRVYLVLAAGLALCELLTFSKTGWVVLAVALWLVAVRFWTWRDQLYVLAAITSIAIILLFVTNDSFRTQVFTIETLTERVQITLDVFRYVNPPIVFLVGSGSQSLQFLLAQTTAELVPGVPLSSLSPHDEFMNVLVKGGLVSLLIFLVALALVLWRARRLARAEDPNLAAFFNYWYAAAWGVTVSLFGGEELHYWPVAAFFWLIAGATVHFARAPIAVTAERTRPDRDMSIALEGGREVVG